MQDTTYLNQGVTMSQKSTDLTAPITVVSSTVEGPEAETSPKLPLHKRAVNKIKKHPKTAIAVGAGVALVTLAALSGKSEPKEIVPALEPVDYTEDLAELERMEAEYASENPVA